MAVSQNGYPVLTAAQTVVYRIGETKSVRLAPGAPGEMLADCLSWFDDHVRDIDPGALDEWGWASRPIRGSTVTSNHASGTAGDVDATKWPLGSDPSKYLTGAEIARVREHLKVYQGCIRWGGDYTGRKDPMHFEINKSRTTVERVWAELKGKGGSYTGSPNGAVQVVKTLQTILHFDPARGEVDGVWGPQTDAGLNAVRSAINGHFDFPGGVKEAQTRVGAVADGAWGPKSKAALAYTIKRLQTLWGTPPVDGVWGPRTEAGYQRDRAAYFRG